MNDCGIQILRADQPPELKPEPEIQNFPAVEIKGDGVEPKAILFEDGIIRGFAEMPKDAIISEIGLAKLIGVTTRTVRRMVTRHELPPGIPFAGRKTWLAGRVLDWIIKRAEEAERKGERDLARIRRLEP